MATEQRLIVPGLAGFYASVGDIAYKLVRVVVGVMFLMHVSVKFKAGASAAEISPSTIIRSEAPTRRTSSISG